MDFQLLDLFLHALIVSVPQLSLEITCDIALTFSILIINSFNFCWSTVQLDERLHNFFSVQMDFLFQGFSVTVLLFVGFRNCISG